MKILRRILIFFAWLLGLLVLGVLIALTPPAQAWLTGRQLERLTGWHATVGSAIADFSSVSASDVRLERGGAVLTIPTIEVTLPLKSALMDHKLSIGKIVAAGWKLELGGPANTGNDEARRPAPELAAARGFAHVAREFVRGRSLPCDLSLDGVELEGEIVMRSSPERPPTGLHVTLKGGGLAAGRSGAFEFDATGVVKSPGVTRAATAPRGRLVVTMNSPRTVQQIAFDGRLGSAERLLPDDFTLSVAATAAGTGGNETYSLKVSRENRQVASIEARFPPETRRLTGAWKLDLQDGDLAQFKSERLAAISAATGEGRLDCDPTFDRMHIVGQAEIGVRRLGAIFPKWNRAGPSTVRAEFDAIHQGQTLRFDRLSAVVGTAQPIANLRAVQPFDLDERTGDLKPTDAAADWLTVSLPKFPLAWLPVMAGGFSFAEGEASGDLTVKARNGGFALASNGPLLARAVVLQRAGSKWGDALDLSLVLTGDFSASSWRAQAAPLLVDRGGRRLATVEAVGSAGASGQPPTIKGTWSTRFETAEVSDEFSASVGTTLAISSKLTVLARAPQRTFSANLQTSFDPYGGVTMRGPIKITAGAGASEFSFAANYTREKAAPRVDVEINAVEATLEHLGMVTAGVAAVGGVELPPNLDAAVGSALGPAQGKDPRPFWGDWTGQMRLGVYRLRVDDLELTDAAGKFDFDHGVIRLTGGRGKYVPPAQPAPKRNDVFPKREEPASNGTIEGTLAFDAAAEFPYQLNAAAAVDTVNPAWLFGTAKSGGDPVLEGRFSVAHTLTSRGQTLADLVLRRREEFRINSTHGILRLLKTDVASSLPEEPTPMKDALGKVGSVVETIMGLSRNTINTGQRTLAKETDAILNFTYQTAELGYDEFTVTAVRRADHDIALTGIAINTPRLRLTGSGQINYAAGQPFRAEPFSLELTLAATGKTAELLSTAHLLSEAPDQPGFRSLNQPIHFGGTLEKIDASQWHDLLVKAALPPPVAGKKGG